MEARVRGKTHLFRLSPSSGLGELVGAAGLSFPRWRLVLHVVLVARELAEQSSRSPATRRVEAHKLAERLRPVAQEVGMTPPPPTRGNPNAWDEVLAWGSEQTAALARGDSPALAS